MESRRAILESVRSTRLTSYELPSLDQTWVRYDDPYNHFAEVLASVGGQSIVASDLLQVDAWLRSTSMFQNARRVASLVPGLDVGNVDLSAIARAHELADLDLVIAEGEIAVAENGAVWVSDRQIPQRAALFIAQHAVLIVPRPAVVHNLHEAYARLQFTDPGFGVFISGPSKTADIEQSLVIGAHGPKSLHVVLVTQKV